MRILIALTYYRPHYSGLTIHAEREARALVSRGHQVTVLTSRFDPNLPFREVKDGVVIIRPKVWLHVSKGVLMPSMPYWAWKLVRDVDVIHLHAPQLDAAPIAVLARLLGKPVVLTYHCDMRLPHGFSHSVANIVSNLANHITARAADVMVHNTRDYAEYSPFMRRYLNKLYPILPPVEVASITAADREAFRCKFNIQPGQRLIGMAARLATEKGVEYLAEALPDVLGKYPQARVLFVGPHLNVVGEESYAQRLTPLIKGLGDHWTFLGVISPQEMAAFFHECEVTVLPSINSTESYGLVQVESMTCSTPVVASDLPGVRVPVSMSGSGLIVPSRDAAALTHALLAVLDDPKAYKGDPQAVAQLSTPEAVAAEYEKAFELAALIRKNPESYKGIIVSESLTTHSFASQVVETETPMPETAIILAGGFGTRLQSVVTDRPKVLADVAGRPFLDYLLTYLAGQGIKRVILSTSYLAEQVQDFAGDGRRWQIAIEYALEESPLGTGGALKYASGSAANGTGLKGAFFALNGDTLFQSDLSELWRFHRIRQTAATISLRAIPVKVGDHLQRGCVSLDETGTILNFAEKPAEAAGSLLPSQMGIEDTAKAEVIDQDVLTNAGVYVLTPEALGSIPDGQVVSLEQQVFPALAARRQLAGFAQSGYFIDIGAPQSLTAFEKDVISGAFPQ